MINYFGKILFINLESDIQKKDEFLNSLNGSILKNHIHRFIAVNGKKLDLRIIGPEIITDIGRQDIISGHQKRFGVSLTYGALGCALSHYLILQECSKQNKPYLIFEDDSRIKKNFDISINNLIDHILLNKIEYDILYLGLHNIPSLNKTHVVDDLLYVPKGLTCGTWAMIITSEGAKKLLQLVFPLTVQIDSEISRIKHTIKVFATRDELAIHSWHFGSSTQRQRGCQTDVGIING